MEQVKMLDTKDLQSILKIGKNSAYAIMRSDTFPSVQIGRKWLVSEEALKEWLDNNKYCSIVIDEQQK